MKERGMAMRMNVFAAVAVPYLLIAALVSSDGLFSRDGQTYAVPLRDPISGQTHGKVEVERTGLMRGLRSVEVTVTRLEPGSVYSAWYADEKGRLAAAGVEVNHFRTDGSGRGRYVTTSYEDLLDDWRYLVINRHPDGDPANTAAMVEALRADLAYGRRPS